ncbi:unnamed protein product [Microthlaspi erraticum]|uniref:Reverse transcriptase domain-containing protein n=1 Tax=Microthlaspi erraticum TaxID=1685480 RepID=A0A6D2L182_9BRAS|nr:unnamed protein product [Microthlaspi erraticum]
MIDVCEGTIELNLGKDLKMKFDIKDTLRKPTIEGNSFIEEMDQLADELLGRTIIGRSTSCSNQGFQKGICSETEEYSKLLDTFRPVPSILSIEGLDRPVCEVMAVSSIKTRSSPRGLRYAFLGENSTYPVIVNSELNAEQLDQLPVELRKYRKAIGYTLDDIKGISPDLCIHRIHLEDESKSSIEPKRRLNPNLKEVVKKEILKLLNAGIIYPISDSTWISPVHCVPKKGGITVIKNDKEELIPTRTIVGHRMCIDYKKLNSWFLPNSNDQEKTTFTCPRISKDAIWAVQCPSYIPEMHCNIPHQSGILVARSQSQWSGWDEQL